MGDFLKKAYEDKATFDFVYNASIGWRKLFEQAQELLREIRKRELLPDEVYFRAIRLCEIESLPKKYQKGVKNG